MSKIVELENVSFGYDHHLVLEDVYLGIDEGDYFGIIGPNGTAKSTLMKLMLNILKPMKGKIKLFGQDVTCFKDWGKIGYVGQKSIAFNTSFPATVEEVVAANLFSHIGLFRRMKKEYWEKVQEALFMVGMGNDSKRLIGNLSGGQQQRVFIARALVNNPKILFLDEPTVGIDSQFQCDFYELMGKLNQKMKMTIVMISHDIRAIIEKANRIACMRHKKLVVHHAAYIPIDKIMEEMYRD
jgi:zinc transport system ATP-binding protein